MVTAFVRRRLGIAVNRKRVLRVMRQRKLIRRRRPLERRKRPGSSGSSARGQLWQLDMTSVWVAEHGWTYLMAIIDCCTREIVAWQLELCCRADEAIALIERAAAVHGIERRTHPRIGQRERLHRPPLPGDARQARHPPLPRWLPRPRVAGLHRELVRETQGEEVWLNEYDTLDDARGWIGGYVDRYLLRPHSGLGYRTPTEVRDTWEDGQRLQKVAPSLSTPEGSRSTGIGIRPLGVWCFTPPLGVAGGR